ncbi:MAG TPA: glycosyltransferase family 39 protein, partial [Tepidisphaeraceae bacterium]
MGLTPPPADDFNHDRPADSAGRFVGADDDIIPLAGDDKETDAPLARPNDPSPPSVGATPASSASVSRLPTRDAGVAPTRKSRRSIRLRALRRLTPILLLLLLTLIGGVMRFTALDKPIIWGDEALTFGRTGGTYEQLLNQLADDSFTPLHYEMIWWLGQGLPYWGEIKTETGERMIRQQDGTRRLEQVTLRRFEPTHRLIPEGVVLTPAMLRLWPAIAGTLMIPAIYFLARQMFGPRIALTAALLVCFNAYLLNHSRDAKMYMPFWLMLTLNVACLMWWLRVRTTRAWLCWVGCGIAMMALHALGAFAL